MSIKDSIPEPTAWFHDEDFLNNLTVLLVQDVSTLKSCASLLSADDFKPVKGMTDGRPRWLVAERALEFWNKHHEPLGKLVRSDVLEYASQISMGANQIAELRVYLKAVKDLKPAAPDAITEKVVRFKSQALMKSSLLEMSEACNAGLLTPEKWAEISQKITVNGNGNAHTVNYGETLEDRIERRQADAVRTRAPWTYIEPLDALIRTVGRREVGLVIAPYKRGKSLFLLWLAHSMILQRLNVLYVTLEDPRNIVEDRMDAIMSAIPIKKLIDKPNTLRRRFGRYKNMIDAQLYIYDGTEGGVTVPAIEGIVHKCREEGFIPDAVITDYDDEITPIRKHNERRTETDEVYRAYRQMCSRNFLIGWLAAQTQRNTRHLKILSGDKVAEDIGKARKVTCAISMGKGDWTDESIFLWVAAHKTDRMDVGCTIIPDLSRSLIFDREATARARRIHPDEA